ncbi:DNA-binding transcriptional response regulator, NtrC family, contains REC, AAA-type ATPase, and a Fis-type DNA-binding domains [Mariprofundus ferrinatatus]|uniref:DNA-binding transcriptional response regulator, NtrC family, contains REC, AAA-type ATPase, and a Fis-type DNA-binding domains n=1 Tax=Mariprofundus ferrinatatus TaxID=1921087 RepID=A0A2K8L6J3_9PROT|nr:sigma-54 dependent transcriptional regulator [Mariprofundus ferrinatatus]ATX82930.1 DNA-binding transcriptional response regulator, NtrC family, contains REC, AAA-type ATPase, and a Fis-type DNA-binding domains [Mariprofundus ferrinatatus]
MEQSAFILLVEDNEEFRLILREYLEASGFHVTGASNATRAREALDLGKFDLCILDVRLPDGNGIELMREFHSSDPEMGIIIMTGYAEVDTAIDAVRLGANDFLKKPFDLDELGVRVGEFLKTQQLQKDNRTLREQVRSAENLTGFTGHCAAMRHLQETVKLLANSDSTILISGESGSGKEVLAKALHSSGSRSKKPLVSINCGAIPEELLESELFGHVKGAFTGAIKSRPGRFELANGGAIFLDEIGDMSPKLQVKLLRVLQERCFEPVGSQQSIEVDVRVIAATHRNLEEEIEAGRFREDLYYRLNVIPLHLPPLRERGDDILLLANHFLGYFNTEKGSNVTGLSSEAKQVLLSYVWPGNVRELRNLIERVCTLKREGVVEIDDLPSRMISEQARLVQNFQIDINEVDHIDLKATVDEFENHLIQSALERFDWNKNRAANFLSMNRTTLVEKIKKKGIVQSQE